MSPTSPPQPGGGMVMTKSSSSSRGLEDVPHRAALSAKYPSTFAYATIKDR